MYQYPYREDKELLERGMKIAMRLHDKKSKDKEAKKDKIKREAEAARLRRLTSLEWFCLGVVSQPIVGVLYNYGIHKIMSLVP